jgi:glycosyltransferase involved in cell wall biosynthesis
MLAEPVDRAAPAVFDADWRMRAAQAQRDVLPGGRVLVSGPAPFGAGGLGRHLKEIVQALEGREASVSCICEASGAHARDVSAEAASSGALPASGAREIARSRLLAKLLSPLTRAYAPASMWASVAEFDRRAARAMREPALSGYEHVIAFNGAALRQLEHARPVLARTPGGSLSLVSATAHIRVVAERHAVARAQYPLERSWAGRLVARTLAEYGRADHIYVSSARVRESFLARGFAEDRLIHFPLTPDPRFSSARADRTPGTFEIVYVGGLSVVKGVPLLVDAVARLAHEDLRLVLVGGWGTRGMRRYIERARARDARISVTLGDPLAFMQRASLYVHPSYDDGFGYAPAEALALGVPVIATEDTGMRELIEPNRNGAVVPAGDCTALAEAIDSAYRGELLRA